MILIGSKYYLDLQSDKAIYRDQSYLATFGKWNRFKVQLRYRRNPPHFFEYRHALSIRKLATVFSPFHCQRVLPCKALPPASTSLPSTIQTQLVPSMNFIIPSIERRSGTVLVSYDFSPVLGHDGLVLS